jgi:hypothetical protein
LWAAKAVLQPLALGLILVSCLRSAKAAAIA